jgi:hydroxyacylglutathione hydrolase
MSAIVGHWDKGAIWRTTSGIFSSNAYFCELGKGQEGILIDPGLDAEAIDAALMANNQIPVAIVCTHGHFDHAGSAGFFQKKYGIKVYIPENDEKLFKASNFLLMAFKIPAKVLFPQEVTYIKSGSDIEVGDVRLYFRSTPGHTPGSCIIQLGSAWFTGDTIYSQGVGLSKLPGENHDQLRASLLDLWEDLTKDVVIYPGHGNAANGDIVKNENKALIQFMEVSAATSRKLTE